MKRNSNGIVPRVYRVLVVEDSLDAVHSTCILLRELGHIAEYALNGFVALDVARRFKPDLVLCDIGLPGADGFEVCRQIRADPELATTRIAAVTAYGDEETRRKGEAAGFDYFFTKPMNLDELVALVGDHKRVRN